MAPVVGENVLFFMLISLDECCGASSAAAAGLIESIEQRADGVMALTPGVPSGVPKTDGVWESTSSRSARSMAETRMPNADDVDQLMLNAQLRTELEPFVDESLEVLDRRNVPTHLENEYLASMLAWERAPVLPIARWFEPELKLPSPDTLDDSQVAVVLAETIERLYSRRIVLECTEHLSDRELLTIIYRDILPAYEKKVDLPKNFLHWHCIDDRIETEKWLRFYATEDERQAWEEETGEMAPNPEEPPYPRRMPRRAK